MCCISDIFHATTIKIALNVAKGILTIKGVKKIIKINNQTACTIPDMGEIAPALILVTVRAIAPVAGSPPKMDEPILATPCARSSVLDLCFVSVIPSATTAERSDSISAKIAIVTASGNKSSIFSKVISGKLGVGSMVEIEPKRLLLVSTGISKKPNNKPSQKNDNNGSRYLWVVFFV